MNFHLHIALMLAESHANTETTRASPQAALKRRSQFMGVRNQEGDTKTEDVFLPLVLWGILTDACDERGSDGHLRCLRLYSTLYV